MIETKTKPCAKCGREFDARRNGRKDRRHGFEAYCRRCRNRDRRERYAATPVTERRRAARARADSQNRWRFQRTYGISFDDAMALLTEQDGRCAICGAPAQHFDHDHARDRPRAWLCQPCNHALGLLGDSPERLEAAARYLRSFAEEVIT